MRNSYDTSSPTLCLYPNRLNQPQAPYTRANNTATPATNAPFAFPAILFGTAAPVAKADVLAGVELKGNVSLGNTTDVIVLLPEVTIATVPEVVLVIKTVVPAPVDSITVVPITVDMLVSNVVGVERTVVGAIMLVAIVVAMEVVTGATVETVVGTILLEGGSD